jgi:hypothetical protein
MPQLEDAFRYGYWQHFIYPMDIVLLPWAAMVVDDATEGDIRNGRPLVFESGSLSRSSHGNRCRVYTCDGSFLAMLYFDSERGQWQPEKVFKGVPTKS